MKLDPVPNVERRTIGVPVGEFEIRLIVQSWFGFTDGDSDTVLVGLPLANNLNVVHARGQNKVYHTGPS